MRCFKIGILELSPCCTGILKLFKEAFYWLLNPVKNGTFGFDIFRKNWNKSFWRFYYLVKY